MASLFQTQPELFSHLDWSPFGLTLNGMQSTFWFGTRGARTACHYDTYGCNLVAQLYGCKRWVLAPPSHTPQMGATRVPYEESSVFSERFHGEDDDDGEEEIEGEGARKENRRDNMCGSAAPFPSRQGGHDPFDGCPLDMSLVCHVDLHPGEVLFVPRHWWHYVRATEDAISANVWLPSAEDPDERVREGMVGSCARLTFHTFVTYHTFVTNT